MGKVLARRKRYVKAFEEAFAPKDEGINDSLQIEKHRNISFGLVLVALISIFVYFGYTYVN